MMAQPRHLTFCNYKFSSSPSLLPHAMLPLFFFSLNSAISSFFFTFTFIHKWLPLFATHTWSPNSWSPQYTDSCCHPQNQFLLPKNPLIYPSNQTTKPTLIGPTFKLFQLPQKKSQVSTPT